MKKYDRERKITNQEKTKELKKNIFSFELNKIFFNIVEGMLIIWNSFCHFQLLDISKCCNVFCNKNYLCIVVREPQLKFTFLHLPNNPPFNFVKKFKTMSPT